MGLDLLPVLVGTVPVLLLIAPTVASGLFVFLTDRYERARAVSANKSATAARYRMAAVVAELASANIQLLQPVTEWLPSLRRSRAQTFNYCSPL